MVIALAGRRPDAPGAAARRFPLDTVGVVQQKLHDLLVASTATTLVSSAACGADLLALVEAGELKLRRRVLLPFDRERFRGTSVVDRPGDWGPVFDRVLDEVDAAGDLIVAGGNGDGDAAYAAANEAILDEAQRLAEPAESPAAAAIVWDGQPRGDSDLTLHFRTSAVRRGMRIFEVLTI